MSTAALANQAAKKLSFDEFVELQEQSEVVEQIDLGSAMMSKVLHPAFGVMILCHTAHDYGAMFFG